MTVIAITRDHRFYASGLRIHHGAAGIGFIAAGLGITPLNSVVGAGFVALGMFLLVDDWKDKPWRFHE